MSKAEPIRQLPPPPEPECVPPRSFEAEQEVLGTILMEPSALQPALRILTPGCFYWEDHKLIFAAICACHQRDEPVDLITVSNELRRRRELEQVGGGAYLTAIMAVTLRLVPSIERHAGIVRDKALLRGLIRACSTCAAACFEDPADVMAPYVDLQAELRRLLDRAAAGRCRLRTVQEAGDDLEYMVAVAAAGRRELSPARLGIAGLDERIGPLSDHRVIVLGAKRGVGKTHVAVNAAVRTCEQLKQSGEPGRVVIFSFESAGMYSRRMLAHVSGINSDVIRLGFDGRSDTITRQHLIAAKDHLKSLPWSIMEGAVGEDMIESELRAHARKEPIALVIVDYWQAMVRRRGRQQSEEFEDLAFRFRNLAGDLECPIIIVSQLTYNRDTGRLQTKGSTAPEEVATMIMWLVWDAKRKQHVLTCDKTREGEEWGAVPVYLDRRVSRVGLIAQQRELPQTEDDRGGPFHDNN